MFWTCSVWDCESNQSSIINGRQMKLFPYPNDKRLKERWKSVCKSVSYFENNSLFRLCELHFEKQYITKDLMLTIDAVPTIFEYPTKRKLESTPRSKIKHPPTKKFKENRANSPANTIKKPPLQNPRKSKELSIVVSNSAKNSVKKPVNSKNPTVRYRLTIDIERIIEKNSSNINQVQNFNAESVTDASRKRKRKESEKKDPEQAEIEIKIEENEVRKGEIEEDENFTFYDPNSPNDGNERITEIPDNSRVENNLENVEKEKDENFRFTGQNIEANRDKVPPSNDILQGEKEEKGDEEEEEEDDYEAEYLTFSDQNDTNEPDPGSFHPSANSHDEENGEAEYLIFPDPYETNILQPSNDSHEVTEDRNEEEGDAEYLLFSDESESNYYQETLSSFKNSKHLWTNANDKRCENGCALEKVMCDENVCFKCVNCERSYNVTNKPVQEISSNTFQDPTKLPDITTRVNLSESQKSMRILSEYLIFTPNVNIHVCKGKCELKDIKWNDTDSFICKNCNNIYKKAIRYAINLTFLDDESFLDDDLLSEDDLEVSDDESSNFWDEYSLTESEGEKEDVTKTGPKKWKANKGKKKLVIDIPDSLSECKDGCQFVKIQWNDKKVLKCSKCNRILNFEGENRAKNDLKLTEKNSQKSKVKLKEKSETLNKKSKQAKDLLKTLEDKSKKIDDMLKTLKQSDAGNSSVRKPTLKLTKNNGTTKANKTRTANDLLKASINSLKTSSDLSKTLSNLPKTPNNVLKKLSDLPKAPNNLLKKLIYLPKTPNNPLKKLSDLSKTRNNSLKTPSNSLETPSVLLETTNEVLKTQDKLKETEVKLKQNDQKENNKTTNTNNQMKPPSDISQENKVLRFKKKIQCGLCKRDFSTAESLAIHFKEHFVCDICYVSFDSQLKLDNHYSIHKSTVWPLRFQCHICDLTFKTQSQLRNHLPNQHNIKPEIQVTNMSIKNDDHEDDLKNDEETNHEDDLENDNEKNHENDHENNHEKHHENNHENHHQSPAEETPSRTQQNSPPKTIESSIASNPTAMRIKFSCNVCEMEFPTLEAITEHTRTHLQSPTKELKCNICMQIFQDNCTFQMHLREHIARSYRCTKCSKAFIDEVSLQTHMLSHEVYFLIQH